MANLITAPEDLTNIAWTANAGTPVITANNAVAPDGTTTADKLEDNDAAQNESLKHNTVSISASTAYVASAFVKKQASLSGIFGLSLRFSGVDSNSFGQITIDPSDGTTAERTGLEPNGGVFTEEFEDYWRVWLVHTSGNHDAALVAIYAAAEASIGGGWSNAATGHCHPWGIVLEAGDAPTTYVSEAGITVTSSAPRIIRGVTSGVTRGVTRNITDFMV